MLLLLALNLWTAPVVWAGDFRVLPVTEIWREPQVTPLATTFHNCVDTLAYNLVPASLAGRGWNEDNFLNHLQWVANDPIVRHPSHEEWAFLYSFYQDLRDRFPVENLVENYRGPRKEFLKLLIWLQQNGEPKKWLNLPGLEVAKKIWQQMEAVGWRIETVFRRVQGSPLQGSDIDYYHQKIILRWYAASPITLARAIFRAYTSFLVHWNFEPIHLTLLEGNLGGENRSTMFLAMDIVEIIATLRTYEKLTEKFPYFKTHYWDEFLGLNQIEMRVARHVRKLQGRPLDQTSLDFLIEQRLLLPAYDTDVLGTLFPR